MRILNAEQIKQADQFTMTTEEISSVNLMEIAGRQLFHHIIKTHQRQNEFVVFCGPGNNGGDGLIIAQLLAQKQKLSALFILKGNYSNEFEINFERIKDLGIEYQIIDNETKIKNLNFNDGTILIDALFGIGISRPLTGLPALLIQKLNTFQNHTIAIDVPSGLSPDCKFVNDISNTIIADETLTVQLPKLAFMFAENSEFVGEFNCINIGLSEDFINTTAHATEYLTLSEVTKLIKARAKFGHKGTFGHALIIAGSKGKLGAAILTAKATLKTGCGLLTSYIPSAAIAPLLSVLPEAMCVAREDEPDLLSDNFTKYNAIGFGPGVGISINSSKLLHYILTNQKQPLILDADALTLLSQNPDWYKLLNPTIILTPHPGEFDRLTRQHRSGHDRFESQLAFSKKHKVFIVLKGQHTSITCPEGKVFFNSTGNNGMAKGGSGDVLTGIITSLCTQGYTVEEAVTLGVFIHGYCGDKAAKKDSKTTMLASDIIDNLKKFFKKFEK